LQALETEVESKLDASEKGAANGVAELDSGGKVPASQLPSYVDDVEEYANLAAFPVTGETGKLYVALDTQKLYRWSGSIYVEIAASPVTSVNGQSGVVVLDTDDVSEGSTNLYFTDARADSRIAAASIDDLSDVDTSTVAPIVNDVLKWDGSNWVPGVGGGAGQGLKNLIEKNDFEDNLTTSWSLGTATLTNNFPSGVPSFGSGANANLSIATISSGQIEGDYSLSYASSSATTAGDFLASDSLPVDEIFRARVLQFSIAYKIASGASNGNFSGSSANSFGIAFYDVTNSQWIQPSGVFNIVQSSGVGLATGTFQTPVDMANVRIVWYNANATSGAISVTLDDFFLGPQIIPQGAAVSDWQSFTPTFFNLGTGALASANGRWRRVGDSMEITVSVTKDGSAGTGAGAVQASIPSGYSVDTTKLASATLQAVGSGLFYPVGTNTELIVNWDSSASRFAFSQNDNTTFVGSEFLANNIVMFYAKVPILGWSSNTVMSSDTDTRVVDFTGTVTTQALTVAVTNIAATAIKDSYGAWTGSTYVVPVSGDYVISSFIYSIGTTFTSGVYINGSLLKYVAYHPQNAGGGGSVIAPNLKAGDIISLRSTNASPTIASDSALHISISRLSGPATIAASETISCSYSTTSGQAINAAGTKIVWNTKDFDDSGSMNTLTGDWTAPAPGKYLVTASAATSSTSSFDINIFFNGVQKRNARSPSTTNPVVSASYVGRLLAGQTIYVTANLVTGNLSTDGAQNNISIVRVGNY
jgi:hypothetical protein